ncbi:LysR family transcriptional regulator [Chitinimonas sp. BJB300]|uniref:LysR family transcriptional regulator n=1 Tax=Chitinimonas sp. BJB300 TaxID=1559339 RepID=UPI000C110A82|nr:LysR family transcriptional regulator [Chitinimonas sp. BJB300]PHV11948.1 LysR family transcriptional regulator [Chitinimonas sp. BJB300]TSJ87288.1 LysR family transcriptional regulator [Chitinimonas sp. BJB300]
MSLSTGDLELLCEVAERGSFSQAAAARGWSQPQVSQRIAQLEASLGASLFQRHRRGAVATPACLIYLESVKRALAELDNGRRHILGSPALPEARVGCPPSLASLVFSPLIAALAEAPLELFCHTDHSPELMERVLSGRLKVAFVLNRPTINGIQLEVLAESPIQALVAATHPLAQTTTTTLAALAAERISPQWWGPDVEALVRLLRQYRRAPLPIHTNQPATTARELALRHGFVVFAPAIAMLDDLLEGRLVPLPVQDLPDWRWQVMMAYRAGKRPDPSREQVLAAARAMGQDWRHTLEELAQADRLYRGRK